jgi:hypothetical protein
MLARSPSPPASALALRPAVSGLPERRPRRRAALGGALAAALVGTLGGNRAAPFTATLNPAAPLTAYLQVGVGSFTGDYIYGGQPENNTTINTVSVSVTSAVLGNRTPQAMTTNSTAAQSYWDGYTYCSVPGQLYIGGFYRTTGGTTAAAQVTATVPAGLTDGSGDTLPFSKIQWTSSGNGDSGAEPFPAGTFVNGGVQTVGSMASNTWNESCWTFTYLNNSVPPAGTFTGVVLYTLSAP